MRALRSRNVKSDNTQEIHEESETSNAEQENVLKLKSRKTIRKKKSKKMKSTETEEKSLTSKNTRKSVIDKSITANVSKLATSINKQLGQSDLSNLINKYMSSDTNSNDDSSDTLTEGEPSETCHNFTTTLRKLTLNKMKANNSIIQSSKPNSPKRMTRSRLQSLNPEMFDNAVTSTALKPKKTKKLINVPDLKDESGIKGLDDISDNVINISESLPEQNTTFNISKDASKEKIKRNTFDMNNTTKDKTGKGDTFDMPVQSRSGEWQVENFVTSVINISDDTQVVNGTFSKDENKENEQDCNGTYDKIDLEKTPETLITSPSPKDQSARKKWQKFAAQSTEANSVLQDINDSSNAINVTRKSIANTTKLEKSKSNKKNVSFMEINLSKSFKSAKPSSSTKQLNSSTNKSSAIKRTVMPNFALLHQKVFDKMESLHEFSERKKQRAEMLMNRSKSLVKNSDLKPVYGKTPAKSSRQLFTNNDSEKEKKMKSLREFSEKKHAEMQLNRSKSIVKFSDTKPVYRKTPAKNTLQSFTNTESEKQKKHFVKAIASKINIKPKSNFSVDVAKFQLNSRIPKPLIKPENKIPIIQREKIPTIQREKIPIIQREKIPTIQREKIPIIRREKVPILARKNIIEMANKKKTDNVVKNRENRRNDLKGVRTNRRFELLMQMRNK